MDADSPRYAYLRSSVLTAALENYRLMDVLLAALEVPGKASVLKALSFTEKLHAIEAQLEHVRSMKTSEWYGVAPLEVLAAVIFRSNMPDRFVCQLFSDAKNERALLGPVSAWLRAQDLHVFDEVPMGANRVDVLGTRKGGWLSSDELVAVELKNDLAQMKRGLDQMATFGQYAHRVYLACTPYLAADYLAQHAEGVKVKHWDPDLLNRKLEGANVGLLLVEGDSVYEWRTPGRRNFPDARKLEEVELALKGR